MMTRKIIFCSLFLMLSAASWSQEAVNVLPSPLSIARMKYKDAYVKLTYSQPHKRGRAIFGSLVQYGQVWRMGANEATEVTLTRDMQINGQPIKAGTYSLFTIPEKEKWTIIINSETGLWGSYNYNEKLDVVRFEVPVVNTGKLVYEALQMKFDQKNELANLLINWDNVQITIPFKFLN
jgi:hypothetical protein